MIQEHEIKSALDNMANIDIELESLALKKQEAIDSILTPEMRKAIEDINMEYSPMEKAATENRASLENFVRSGTIEFGKTVTSTKLQAVFVNGKKTWDMKKVAEYLESHPELGDMYTQGAPYVQIKKVKAEDKKEEQTMFWEILGLILLIVFLLVACMILFPLLWWREG